MLSILSLVLNEVYSDLQANYYDPSHVYEIRVLQIPLFCEQIGAFSRRMNITHAGIGFFDLNDTSKQVIVQYNIRPFNYTFKFLDFLRPIATMN